jgi:hypothetical protein
MGKKSAEPQEQPMIWEIPMTIGRSSKLSWTNIILQRARGIVGKASSMS